MYGSVFSALLLGMWPVINILGQGHTSILASVSVAPPLPEIEINSPISASGAVIMDMESGQIVFEKQAETVRPMASITKLMTALIVAEDNGLDEVVVVPKEIDKVVGNKAYLPEGKRFTVGDMLSALLISSANDAATVLAVHHSGSVPAFVEAMNERARQLGLVSTSYADPIGLDHAEQYSTPKEIASLTKYVMQNPEIASRMGKRWARIYSTDGTEEIILNHTHAMMHDSISPVTAGKTGTTDAARQCLVSVFPHEGREYIAVLMYSGERYKDMQTILDEMGVTVL